MCPLNLQSRAVIVLSLVGLIAWLLPVRPVSARELPEVQSGTLYLKASPDAEATM